MTHWYEVAITPPCEHSREAARAHQSILTKPPGSLGRLEDIAEQFAAWQGRKKPALNAIAVRIFAADHGVSAQGVSAFPADVTVQMVQNFIAGGAAISVLSKQMTADFAVVNMGCLSKIPSTDGLVNVDIAAGTRDFSREPAMTQAQMFSCLEAGKSQLDGVEADLFVGGEMGIANTTSAAALLAAITGFDVGDVVGRGTGVNDAGLEHKAQIITDALSRHSDLLKSWQGILQAVGGFEIVALAGAYIRSAWRGIPCLVDGFIATVAALVACTINEGVKPWLLSAHRSAEAGHGRALEALGLEPLLRLDMRLGEGSGAAVAVPLVQSALRLHCDMATFAEAGVDSGA